MLSILARISIVIRPRMPPPSSESSLRGPGLAILACTPANMSVSLKQRRIHNHHMTADLGDPVREVRGASGPVSGGLPVPYEDGVDVLRRRQRQRLFDAPKVVPGEHVELRVSVRPFLVLEMSFA